MVAAMDARSSLLFDPFFLSSLLERLVRTRGLDVRSISTSISRSLFSSLVELHTSNAFYFLFCELCPRCLLLVLIWCLSSLLDSSISLCLPPLLTLEKSLLVLDIFQNYHMSASRLSLIMSCSRVLAYPQPILFRRPHCPFPRPLLRRRPPLSVHAQ